MDIVCINDIFSQEFLNICLNIPKKDSMYTIREIRKTIDGKTGILLNELHNTPVRSGEYTFEPGFDMERFRKIDGSKLSREELKIKNYVPVYVPNLQQNHKDTIFNKAWGK